MVELSSQEYAVLHAISRGATGTEIAAHLQLANETVRAQTAQLVDKLHARSRTHAIARAYQLGLLDPTRP